MIRDISAFRVGSLLLDLVPSAGIGEICATFSTSYAILCRSLVYTVSGRGEGSPLGIELKDPPSPLTIAMIGEPVFMKTWGLSLPGLHQRIAWAGAKVWDGKKALTRITVEQRRLAERATSLLDWVRDGGLCLGIPHSGHSGCVRAKSDLKDFSETLRMLRLKILAQLQSSDPSTSDELIRESAISLMGLGPGLTPSGDDFLTGLILCLTCVRHASPHLEKCLQIITSCIQQRWQECTNPFGGSSLFSATQFQAPEVIDHVLQAIWAGQVPLEPAIMRLAAVGNTSGGDTLLGIATGVELAMPYLLPRCGNILEGRGDGELHLPVSGENRRFSYGR